MNPKIFKASGPPPRRTDEELCELLRAAESGDQVSARRLLIHAARRIEERQALPTAILDFIGASMRSLALGKVPDILQVDEKQTKPTEAMKLERDGTSRGLRLASIIRLFDLAGVARSAAVSALAGAAEVSDRTVYKAVEEFGVRISDKYRKKYNVTTDCVWMIILEDVDRLREQASGVELNAIRVSRNEHCRILGRFLLQ